MVPAEDHVVIYIEGLFYGERYRCIKLMGEVWYPLSAPRLCVVSGTGRPS